MRSHMYLCQKCFELVNSGQKCPKCGNDGLRFIPNRFVPMLGKRQGREKRFENLVKRGLAI